MPAATFQIPPLLCFTLQRNENESTLGLQICQGENDAVEVSKIAPDGPASRTPLQQGYEILSINDHRIRDAARCVEMLKFYAVREGNRAEIVASSGQRPKGAVYVMAKRRKNNSNTENNSNNKKNSNIGAPSTDLGDGSFEGLFLEEGMNRVRISGLSKKGGLFLDTKMNKGDIILSIDGRPIHCIEDCHRALKRATRTLIPVLTYNLFRKFRGSIVVRSDSSGFLNLENNPNGGDDNNNNNNNSNSQEETNSNKAVPKTKPESRCVGELYAFGPKIGSGGFSVVRKVRKKETGETYAMKIVNRKLMDKTLEKALNDEISILYELQHPHVMRLYDTFATINTYYLVTEYLDGGELFDRIVQKATYTEGEARDVCHRIFRAMNHCHQRRVVHRDLKPENLILRSRDDDMDLKIADFGFAKRARTEHSLRTVCGSPGYVSPEILKRINGYGTKTDMWSIGVITFILLGGYPPFQHKNQNVQFTKIKMGRYEFKERYWAGITDEAKSLITSLLCVNPDNRLSASDALDHPWMKVKEEGFCDRLSSEARESFVQFNLGRKKFKSAVRSVIFMNRLANMQFSEDEKQDEELLNLGAVRGLASKEV